jgi:CubicO group peptidase (beta-lactamase class C family)
MLLGGGSCDGVRILRPETVAEMQRNQIGELTVSTLRSGVPERSNDANLFPGMVQKWGLGFLINTEPGPAGRSAGSLAWAGLGNTYFWIDPARNVAGVLMTQILPFADAAALDLLATFERAVYTASAAAIPTHRPEG